MNSKYRREAIRLARQAGALIAKAFSRPESVRVRYKKHNETVTAIDKAAEKIIISGLKRRWPDHGIMSEESRTSKGTGEYTWIIDPIDGTFNFTIKIPLFMVVIALAHQGRTLMSVLYQPMTKKLYWAERGAGAYLGAQRLRVSRKSNFGHAINTWSYGKTADINRKLGPVYGHFRRQTISLKHLGTASLECSLLAQGITDGHLSLGLRPWDNAPGALLITEAGGMVTDWQGRPWTLRSTTMAASNGILHQRLLRELRSAVRGRA